MKGDAKIFIIVHLYVDDMIIIRSGINVINATTTMLASRFDMKDLGITNVILCIKVTKTSEGYALSQTYYVEQVFDKFYKENSIEARRQLM